MEFDEDSSSSWESFDEEQEENVCHKISSNSLVLEKVFEHLSVKDLLSCRLVNKLWNHTALGHNNLGTQTLITINRDNIQRLNQTIESTRLPFCRQFILQLELDTTNLAPWMKVFKNYLSYLSLDCCSATSPKMVARLLKAPNLRQLKITGGSLPEFSSNSNPFRRHPFSRLSKLELCSSDDNGQISREFMEVLLTNSTTALQSMTIRNGTGNGLTLWNDFIHLAPRFNLKINQLALYNLTAPLDITDFEFLRRWQIRLISLHNCIVWRAVLQSLLETVGISLQNLCVLGAQHEILSGSFNGLRLNQLTHLTLPIDGISTEDGMNLLQAMPNLQEFNVLGLFHTKYSLKYSLCESVVMTMDVNGFLPSRSCKRLSSSYENNLDMDLASEKRRELHKLLLFLQPRKLRINLMELDSNCLRKIWQVFPHLQELVVINNSRNSLDGWTGIPIKTCRKLSSCKSFGVANANLVQKLCSVSSLKKLKRLEISIIGDPPKAEFTLIYILYGICQLQQLEELSLKNFTISDIAFVALSKALRLKFCYINGSLDLWNQFKLSTQNNKVRSFLLPPRFQTGITDPLSISKILNKIFTFLSHRDVYNVRLVSKLWHTSANGFLHSNCDRESRTLLDMDKFLNESNKPQRKSQPSPNKTPRKILTEPQSGACSVGLGFCWVKTLEILRDTSTLVNLVIRGMNKSMLEYYQRENAFILKSCEDRRKLIYWFFPDGSDKLLIPNPQNNPVPTSLILIGSWGKKDTGLLEFLGTASTITSVTLHGLISEVYDLILPRLGAMRNLESLTVMPFSSESVAEISMRHLQILSNASFALKHLIMKKLQAPPSELSDLVRSCRYTLEFLEIQNIVNVSDRLSFTIPNLRVLQLDEPPGVGLWTTLNINQNVTTVHFDRSGYIYNQIKSKPMPKLEQEEDFEHFAQTLLVDVNLFIGTGAGTQRSILQDGADSAQKFFSHFRCLTSLTLRSVHGHYGILQGICRNLTQLEKLVFTNTTGVTDEILTGMPKYLLDRIDLMNPLNFNNKKGELWELSNPSIRNLKNLTHLTLDDQVTCTDLSIIFGVIRLKRLEYFSCKKWRITDLAVRAITDMTSIKYLTTDDCPGVSSYGTEYFRNKTLHRLGS